MTPRRRAPGPPRPRATVTLRSRSEEDTRAIGRRLAPALRGGERIGLSGELGAGKTCLVRGLAEGLGIPEGQVRSPSFPIVVPYEGGRLPLYHIDLFRLPAADIDSVALREYIYGSGVCAIEWYERLDEPLGDFLAITITFVDAEERAVVAVAHGVGYDHLVAALRDPLTPSP